MSKERECTLERKDDRVIHHLKDSSCLTNRPSNMSNHSERARIRGRGCGGTVKRRNHILFIKQDKLRKLSKCHFGLYFLDM